MRSAPDEWVAAAAEAGTISEATTKAISLERSLWAAGSVHEDDFYRVDAYPADTPLGAVLKLEASTDIHKYELPVTLALSRFIYLTETVSGRRVPASASIMWPATPRLTPIDGKLPVVVWAHGTTGIFAECAPSHMKKNFLDFPFPSGVALGGFPVVCPDYAGLGVNVDGEGKHIPHEYMGHPANAADCVYAAQAAMAAFPSLSKSFAVIGHSQGGGAAWGVAEREAHSPTPGYLGSAALCPVTNALRYSEQDDSLLGILAGFSTPALTGLYPDFKPASLFTESGLKQWETYEHFQGALPSAFSHLVGSDFPLVKPDWREHPLLADYIHRTHVGGKGIAGPLLVITGGADIIVTPGLIAEIVNETKASHPEARIRHMDLPGLSHDGMAYASQWIWLDWVAALFQIGKEEVQVPAERPRPPSDFREPPSWVAQ